MKAKKTILLCVILLLGGLTEGLKAQENLNALMKKCENMDTIDMNVIYNKNRETKKTEKIIKTVTFSNNQKLLDEFVTAFEKDKDAAYKIIDDKERKTAAFILPFRKREDGYFLFTVSFQIRQSDGQQDRTL